MDDFLNAAGKKFGVTSWKRIGAIFLLLLIAVIVAMLAIAVVEIFSTPTLQLSGLTSILTQNGDPPAVQAAAAAATKEDWGSLVAFLILLPLLTLVPLGWDLRNRVLHKGRYKQT